jgi:Mechanosensitive ion channel, beta-domain
VLPLLKSGTEQPDCRIPRLKEECADGAALAAIVAPLPRVPQGLVSVTIGWRRMAGSDVFIIGSSFLDKHSHQLTAILTLVLAVVFAVVADRGVSQWAARADLNPALDTHVRFIRRLITVGNCVLGVLLAVSQFRGLNDLAAGLLASSAIIAATVGFAARQTLANPIAGVMLTIAQPLRIGDQVTIVDQTGVVEDVRLNYTVLRTTNGRRLLIPNERLAAVMIRNDTILDDYYVRPEASVWLPPAGDTDIAVSTLASIEERLDVRVAEITPEGVRMRLMAEPIPAPQRAAREADLRAAALTVAPRS